MNTIAKITAVAALSLFAVPAVAAELAGDDQYNPALEIYGAEQGVDFPADVDTTASIEGFSAPVVNDEASAINQARFEQNYSEGQ